MVKYVHVCVCVHVCVLVCICACVCVQRGGLIGVLGFRGRSTTQWLSAQDEEPR